jgi:hypothetical protein
VEAQTSERVPPKRLSDLNAPRGASAEVLDAFSWYGGMALFGLLRERGVATSEDLSAILELSRLIDYRPFSRIDECIVNVFWRPNQVTSLDIGTIDQTIEATEEWIKLISSNKFFLLLMQNPPTEEEFSLELRKLGAAMDLELYSVMGGVRNVGPETLIPGAGTFLNLKEASEFVYDTEATNDGRRECRGLRDFRNSLVECMAKQDVELTRIFGTIAVKAFNEFSAPWLKNEQTGW